MAPKTSSSIQGAATLLLFCIVGLSQLSPSSAFIRASGTRFVDENGQDFAFVGANAWRLLESQAGKTGEERDGMTATEWVFKTASENDISVIRMFAAGVKENFPLQTDQGEYNEEALVALDETLNLADKYDVMVTLVLARFWDGPDSVSNYASWTGIEDKNFFSEEGAIQAFKDHMTFMANRVNTVNGKTYRDDETIFSWNLMNEPRFFGNNECRSDPSACADTMANWIQTTSEHLKSEDPNHMIAIGSEGFFGSGSQYEDANPEGGWAARTYQDFERNTAHSSIDYVVAHLWLDNWRVVGNEEFVKRWIDAHKIASDKLNKPLHLEEFGMNTTSPFSPGDNEEERIRKDTFKLVFDELERSLENGESLRAASYWMWDPNLQSTDSNGYNGYKQDHVPVDSDIFQEIIKPAATSASEFQGNVEVFEPKSTSATSSPVKVKKASGSEQAATGGRKLKMLVRS